MIYFFKPCSFESKLRWWRNTSKGIVHWAYYQERINILYSFLPTTDLCRKAIPWVHRKWTFWRLDCRDRWGPEVYLETCFEIAGVGISIEGRSSMTARSRPPYLDSHADGGSDQTRSMLTEISPVGITFSPHTWSITGLSILSQTSYFGWSSVDMDVHYLTGRLNTIYGGGRAEDQCWPYTIWLPPLVESINHLSLITAHIIHGNQGHNSRFRIAQ